MKIWREPEEGYEASIPWELIVPTRQHQEDILRSIAEKFGHSFVTLDEIRESKQPPDDV